MESFLWLQVEMNYIVYVPVKNVLNLYLKIKNLLNKFIWEYAILSQ